MNYSVEWANDEQTILVQKYFGNIQVADFYQVIEVSAKKVKSVDHPVDLILDVTEAKVNMKGFLQASSFADKNVPDNQRLVVVAGAMLFIQVMARIAESIAPKATKNIYFVDTLEEAYTTIEKFGESII